MPTSRVSPRRATYFSLSRQRNLGKRKATRWSGSFWGQSPNSPSLRLALRVRCDAPQRNGCLTPITQTCGARQKRGQAQTRLRLKQVPALIRFCLRSSAQPDGWGERIRTRGALTRSAHQGLFQFAVMFARVSSTRGQMKSPSIAQRGEGGVRGGSGELDPTAHSEPQTRRLSTRRHLGKLSASSSPTPSLRPPQARRLPPAPAQSPGPGLARPAPAQIQARRS